LWKRWDMEMDSSGLLNSFKCTQRAAAAWCFFLILYIFHNDSCNNGGSFRTSFTKTLPFSSAIWAHNVLIICYIGVMWIYKYYNTVIFLHFIFWFLLMYVQLKNIFMHASSLLTMICIVACLFWDVWCKYCSVLLPASKRCSDSCFLLELGNHIRRQPGSRLVQGRTGTQDGRRPRYLRTTSTRRHAKAVFSYQNKKVICYNGWAGPEA
jgi:hypothetical protein